MAGDPGGRAPGSSWVLAISDPLESLILSPLLNFLKGSIEVEPGLKQTLFA